MGWGNSVSSIRACSYGVAKFTVWRRLTQAWNEERDLHAGTVHALYEDAFDVGGL